MSSIPEPLRDLRALYSALSEWRKRAASLIPPEDREVLLSTPRLLRVFAEYALSDKPDHPETAFPGV